MTKVMKVMLLTLLNLGMYKVTWAQNTSLTLEQSIKLALKKSENIQQAIIDIQRAEAQTKEAWAEVFPQISASVQSIRYLKSPVLQFNGTSVPIKQDWELLSSLQINQALFGFGRVSHALEMAKISNRMQATAKEAVERELRYAVELAYYGVVSAKNILQIVKDSLENAKKNKAALERRFQGGRIPRLDNLRMSSDIAGRVPIVSDAEKRLSLAYLQLNLLTEMNGNSRPILTTSMKEIFPSVRKDSLIRKVYESPQLKSVAMAVELAEQQAQLAKAQHYPILSAFGRLDHSGTGETFPPEDERLFTTTSVGLALNIPIFEGGATSARHSQAVLNKARAQLEFRKRQENMVVEFESAIEEYKTNIIKYNTSKKAVSLAKQAYELTRIRFQTGGVTRNDLNDSERALTNARIQQESALYEIYMNKASIKSFTEKVVL